MKINRPKRTKYSIDLWPLMCILTSMSKKITITIQVPVELHASIQQAQRDKGFKTLSSFVRHTLETHAPIERATSAHWKERASNSKARALAALAAPKEMEQARQPGGSNTADEVARRKRVSDRLAALRIKNTPLSPEEWEKVKTEKGLL